MLTINDPFSEPSSVQGLPRPTFASALAALYFTPRCLLEESGVWEAFAAA